MTRAWWTKLHLLTRLVLFLIVCLHAALGREFLPQLLLFCGLLLLLFACGAAGPHARLLLWAHLLGLPATVLLFLAIGYETARSWPEAISWGLVEALRYALRLECLFLANLVFIGITSPQEIISLFTRRWIPPAVGTLLSTAVRFLPLTLTEARRIYDIQRCRGLRLRPWAPRSCLPIIVPLFVSQMCRAHDTSVMLVVRRIATGTRGTSPRKFGLADLLVLGLAIATCIPMLF
jgi:energy-coupling factor transporter transmembrane protein EcfT